MSYITISSAVGPGASNKSSDVLAIQVMLNHFQANMWLHGIKKLAEDGDWGPKTREALSYFMARYAVQEHSQGVAKPSGATISAMNEYAGDLGPVSKPSSPAKSSTSKTKNLVDEAIEFIKKSRTLSESEEKRWRNILMVLFKKEFGIADPTSFIGSASNIHKWCELSDDLLTIWKSIGIDFSAGAAWTVGQYLGFIAPFLQFASFVMDLSDAMDKVYLTNQAVGTAFGVVHWVYEDDVLTSSKSVSKAVKEWSFKPSRSKMRDHWIKGYGRGMRSMNYTTKQFASESGVGYAKARDAIRMALRTASKTTVAKSVLLGEAKKLKERGEYKAAWAVEANVDSKIFAYG